MLLALPLFPLCAAGRTLAMYGLYVAGMAFFMIPVAAVQGLLSMNSFLE